MSALGQKRTFERPVVLVRLVPPADIAELVKGGRQVALSSQDHGNRPKLSARSRCREALPGSDRLKRLLAFRLGGVVVLDGDVARRDPGLA